MDLPLGQAFTSLSWVLGLLVSGQGGVVGRQGPSQWGHVPALALARSYYPYNVMSPQ